MKNPTNPKDSNERQRSKVYIYIYMYTDRHRDRGSSRFPAFSSWSSARKRVALATVSDCPGRCTRLCQRMPWRLRRLMAGIMQTHGATYTRHTPVCHVCLKRADYSRISPDANSPSPLSSFEFFRPAPIYPYLFSSLHLHRNAIPSLFFFFFSFSIIQIQERIFFENGAIFLFS